MADTAKQIYEAVFLGKFGQNSNPIHPSTVHFPIALLVLANALHVVYALIPLSTMASSSDAAIIAWAGHSANILGIFASVPSILTGVAELLAMIQGNGLWTKNEKGEQVIVPKVKTTITHAALNDLAVGIAVYNWYLQRDSYEHRPASHQILISAASLMIVLYSAHLGGGLVYARGVGVQRQGKGAELKKQAMDKYAAKKNGKSQ